MDEEYKCRDAAPQPGTASFTPLFDHLSEAVGYIPAGVYGVIWRYCKLRNSQCYASQATIAETLGISRRSVVRSLAVLESAGFIVDLTPTVGGRPHVFVTGDMAARLPPLPPLPAGTIAALVAGYAKRKADDATQTCACEAQVNATEALPAPVSLSAAPVSLSAAPVRRNTCACEAHKDTSKIPVKDTSEDTTAAAFCAAAGAGDGPPTDHQPEQQQQQDGSRTGTGRPAELPDAVSASAARLLGVAELGIAKEGVLRGLLLHHSEADVLAMLDAACAAGAPSLISAMRYLPDPDGGP